MHPAALIDRFIKQIKNNCEELFTISYEEVLKLQSKKGFLYYGKLFARPSKRLTRLLTVEKEILVFISTFTEQQFRSIQILKDIINEAEGRLEKSVAIIVHCDSTANNKLKKWGRENSITILPIYVERDLPTSDVLESILFRELFSHDPFDITGPVSDDSQFYGRRTEAIELARKLKAGQIRSYLGIRKVGKTSIINRSLKETRNLGDCISFFVDCSKDSIWKMTASELVSSIAESVSLSNNTPALSQFIINPTSNSLSIEESCTILIDEINKSDKSIILFFDEVDYITPSSPTAAHWESEFNIFWRNIRAVYQDITRLKNNLGLFVSGVSTKWFMVESINGIENAALSLIPEEYLSPMSRKASTKMIQILGRTSGLIFSEQDADFISSYCSDFPYWVRKACSYIHRNIDLYNRPYDIQSAEIRTLLDKFLEQEGGVLSRVAIMHLMKVYPELQENAIKCYNNNYDECPKLYLNILEKYGVIKNNPRDISGAMMREGLKLFVELKENDINVSPIFSESSTSSNGKLKFENYEDWADELAIVGRERTLIEKQLRGIVVNFIRQDAIKNKNKGTTLDRVLKIIPTESRRNYAQLLPEQILDKYTWLELSKLIEKEWAILEGIFNDKNEFKLNAANVNIRSDAHAKEADLADIALQRNSLRWFQEKLRVL